MRKVVQERVKQVIRVRVEARRQLEILRKRFADGEEHLKQAKADNPQLDCGTEW